MLGVGFKSVFACSDCPTVVSGKFRFRFETPGLEVALGSSML